jgi:hypothetical protein
MTDEEKKVNDLDEALDKERKEFNDKIHDVIKMIHRIDNISEAQVLMLSYRHMLVDKMTKLRGAIYRKKTNDENFRKLRYEYYKTQHDVRLDYREINQFIASDMALRTRQTDLLDAQVNYYTQCIDTLDKMGFAIKAKITIEEINDRRNFN